MGCESGEGRRGQGGRSNRGVEMTRRFELRVDEKGQLVLARPGEEDVVDVRVRRAFPWSSESRFISIRSSEGKELMLIEDLASVEPEQRCVLEQWLDGG